MKAIAGLVLAILLCTGNPASAESSWLETFDKFDKYPASPLPAPWEGNANATAYSSIGYGGTAAFQWPTQGWDWGYACRPIVEPPRVGDSMVARVYFPKELGWRQVRFGLTMGKNPSESGGFADGAKADIYITTTTRIDPDGNFSYWSFTTTDSAGKSLGAADNGAPIEAWYDVRLTLAENHKVIAQFKNVKMNNWVPIGVLRTAEDFQPRYVSISSSRGGTMDDVGYVRADGSNW